MGSRPVDQRKLDPQCVHFPVSLFARWGSEICLISAALPFGRDAEAGGLELQAST